MSQHKMVTFVNGNVLRVATWMPALRGGSEKQVMSWWPCEIAVLVDGALPVQNLDCAEGGRAGVHVRGQQSTIAD
jgi:hypothetical protein